MKDVAQRPELDVLTLSNQAALWNAALARNCVCLPIIKTKTLGIQVETVVPSWNYAQKTSMTCQLFTGPPRINAMSQFSVDDWYGHLFALNKRYTTVQLGQLYFCTRVLL